VDYPVLSHRWIELVDAALSALSDEDHARLVTTPDAWPPVRQRRSIINGFTFRIRTDRIGSGAPSTPAPVAKTLITGMDGAPKNGTAETVEPDDGVSVVSGSAHAQETTDMVAQDERRVVTRYPTVVDEAIKNRVQWGPIIAGVAITVASMVVLSILGLAVGASAFEPRDRGENLGTWAAVWGGGSAILSYFLGGWVAASSASVIGKSSGLLNGFMVGAVMLVLVLYMTGSGLGNLFGAIGSNVGDIANVVQDQADLSPGTAQDQADEAAEAARSSLDEAFDTVRDGAWGTLIGLVLALGAAAVGGLVGANTRRDLRDRAASI
jgi:hypothetical protein